MTALTKEKAAARQSAFARRRAAHKAAAPDSASALATVLSLYRRWPVSGYLPICAEIDPLSAEAAANGPVGVPVIAGPGLPLNCFSSARNRLSGKGATKQGAGP